MRKLLLALVAIVMSVFATSCSDISDDLDISFGFGGRGSDDPITIVAATELQDLEPLIDQASADLGFDIHLEFPAGTLENSQNLANGAFDGQVDATWFASNRYVDLIGASDKLSDETSIATSPVAFGMWKNKAEELGWVSAQPTWQEFAQAAAAGEFTFGMTDPTASNSGFSALLSVATALADTGTALTEGDIIGVSDQLTGLYSGQTATSGSSGWLADTFLADQGRTDAIINYESSLYQLRDEGHDLAVIVPRDGVISADYPLSTLANSANPNASGQVHALSTWLLDHQQEIADTYRRPVLPVDNVVPEIAQQPVIELAFPANYTVVEALLDAYNNELRAPGTTTFVLDASGSMEGERMMSLQQIMRSLINGTAEIATGNVSLRNREQVTLWSFNSTPHQPLTVTYDRSDPVVLDQLLGYVNNIVAADTTAVYETLYQALLNADVSHGIASIVLLSDGEVTEGPGFGTFRDMYYGLDDERRNIPVFVILYGEANAAEMRELADLTGGEVFDALNGDLAEAFKEIRGYQ